MHTFGTRSNQTWVDPAPTKRERLVKFLMAITIARPSELLKLPSKKVVAKEFRLGEEQANVVFHYVSKFFECLRREGIFPFVHMVWGGGILAKWGVLDYAGGIVVHNIAGIAALASIVYVGKRKVLDRGPHSIPLVALGTGLIWFGWYGFNAGSEFRVDSVTAVAFLNTDVAASFAAIAWLTIEWMTVRKPKFLGLLTGAVAGLATITPAAGYVSPAPAALIGIIAGIVCYCAVALKNKLGWDDALDVWGVHGVGGFLGIVLLGVFATTRFNPNGVNGLLEGNPRFFMVQLGAVAISSIWAFVFTLGMLWLINKVTPVRVEDATEEAGLDEGLHGEQAYLGEGVV